MANTEYKVKSGDALSEIAEAYVERGKINDTLPDYVSTFDNNIRIHGSLEAKIRYLLYMNPDITNRDIIYVNQVIILYGSPAKKTSSGSTRATITAFGLMANTDNTLFATWSWSRTYTEKYQVRWMYQVTENGDWYPGDTKTISVDDEDPAASRFSTYSMPSNAIAVSFQVKPISYVKEDASSSVVYRWVAEWSTKKIYTDWANVLPDPSAPTVEIDENNKYMLQASLDNLDADLVGYVEFEVVKNNKTVCYSASKAYVYGTGYASKQWKIELGSVYKVRCRFCHRHNSSCYTDWSPYSSNVQTVPIAPARIEQIYARNWNTDNKYSVYLKWTPVASATSYDIQYATLRSAFTGNTDDVTAISNITTNYYETFNLEAGHEYFFRVRANNSGGSSNWSNYKSVALGRAPAAPTTWSSTTTAVVGDPLVLYWVHNSEDGSVETFAQLEVYANDPEPIIQQEIRNTNADETTKSYKIYTSKYEEGATLSWRVRTAGVTQTLGDWSIMRTVTINAPPTLGLTISHSSSPDDDPINIITRYPFHIGALAGPSTQAPIGYHLSIISNNSYSTVDDTGNTTAVGAGDIVYSRYFDTKATLSVWIYSTSVLLKNNHSYTVVCTAAMNSGLTSEASMPFTVALDDTIGVKPNAEIGIDESSYSAFIRPYCEDLEGNIITADVRLSVYRRELDGTFTAIAEDLYNSRGAFIVDPHPSLDYARYRIVATHKKNGDCEYFDLPAQKIGCKSIVIQWNEEWKDSFYDTGEGLYTDDIWSGSMLKFPYNIDISDKHDVDVSMVEYAGRKHPVTYYGTQVGESSTWSVVIEKSDLETLAGLRRLAKWPGDVYVREPSGIGYWANVKVSFSRKHLDKSIPVTFEVTRVEGGV